MNTKGEIGRGTIGVNWEVGIDIYTRVILCIILMSDENRLCSSENSVFYGDLHKKQNKAKQGHRYTYSGFTVEINITVNQLSSNRN